MVYVRAQDLKLGEVYRLANLKLHTVGYDSNAFESLKNPSTYSGREEGFEDDTILSFSVRDPAYTIPVYHTISISSNSLPDGMDQLFVKVSSISRIANVTDKKARRQALRNVYEERTNQSAERDHGPVSIIEDYAGLYPDYKKMWPARGRRVRGHGGGLRLKTVRRSHRPEKKWDAVFERNGREKVVPFGARGMSNYTKHKNATRKQRYIRRHSGQGERWSKPDTPGALSKWILWNKPSFKASLASYKRRFHLG